jgi:hypothetical protein
MSKICSKTLSQLFKHLDNNLSTYQAISNYNGTDFKDKISTLSPSDSIIKIKSGDIWDVNLCILPPHTFYYNKIPSFLKILEGCVWTELQIGAAPVNPGFMLDTNKSIELAQPHILFNTGMNKRNVILTVHKNIDVQNTPLL